MFQLESLWHLGALALLIALAWGAFQYFRRNRANDKITEEATRELYDDPDAYDERREELKERIRPS